MARTIAKVCGKDDRAGIQNKFRKGDVRHCYADNAKLRERLGWQQTVSYEDGIRELVEWSEKVEAEDKFDEAATELKAKGLVSSLPDKTRITDDCPNSSSICRLERTAWRIAWSRAFGSGDGPVFPPIQKHPHPCPTTRVRCR